MTIRRIIVFAILGLIGPAALKIVRYLYSPASTLQRVAADYGHTRSTDTVAIELQNPKASIHLRIPKAYLIFKPNWNGGRQDFVDLEAALPDLNPAVLDRREVVPVEDLVLIKLQVSIPGGTTNFVHKTIQELRRDEEDAGFMWYYDKSIFGPNGIPHIGPADEEYAVPLDQDADPHIFFRCVPPEAGRQVGCTAFTELHSTDAASVSLEYHIRRSELGRWREIDPAVRKLVASFIDPNSAAP